MSDNQKPEICLTYLKSGKEGYVHKFSIHIQQVLSRLPANSHIIWTRFSRNMWNWWAVKRGELVALPSVGWLFDGEFFEEDFDGLGEG
jgi:hypothetical protein